MITDLDEYELALESGFYLERDCYSKLLSWKMSRARKHVACFLKGARRVGKSVLALELAHKEYRSFIKISFDKASIAIKNLFLDSLDDLDYGCLWQNAISRGIIDYFRRNPIV